MRKFIPTFVNILWWAYIIWICSFLIYKERWHGVKVIGLIVGIFLILRLIAYIIIRVIKYKQKKKEKFVKLTLLIHTWPDGKWEFGPPNDFYYPENLLLINRGTRIVNILAIEEKGYKGSRSDFFSAVLPNGELDHGFTKRTGYKSFCFHVLKEKVLDKTPMRYCFWKNKLILDK